VRTAADVDALRMADPELVVPFVHETVRIVSHELPAHVPLIGFAGAPFTLFCYLVEGQGSKSYPAARALLYSDPHTADRLLNLLADYMTAYLESQARAGARALMLFDSWAGILSPRQYERFALPAASRILHVLRTLDVPLIYFPNGVRLTRSLGKTCGADVIGVDWRTSLSEAAAVLGQNVALQGNLDPAALFAPRDVFSREIDRVLTRGEAASGHIFNLGHGIDRATDPDQVAFLVDRVHERTSR
jgi:uroporphyrinogen decarboxylase